ncbi:Uncharacterised protein [uncultured archaeon]|nr:Uncharacterised protein [uncultured archaeon]
MSQDDLERNAAESSTEIDIKQKIEELKNSKVIGAEYSINYNIYPPSESSWQKAVESATNSKASQAEEIKPSDEAMLALLHWNLLPHPQIIDTWPRNGSLNVARKLKTFSIIFSKQIKNSWSLSSDAFLLGNAEIIHEEGSPIFIFKRENWKDLLPPRTRITLVINPKDHDLNFMDLERRPASNNQYISFTTD